MTTREHRLAPPVRGFCLCGLLMTTFGCGAEEGTISNPPVPVAEEPSPEAEEPAVDTSQPYETTISGFRFTIPAGWNEIPLRPEQEGIVAANFEIPAAGEDVALTFTASGGGIQANVNRWIGQFTLPEGLTPETESMTVDGLDVTWVKLQGTFSGMRGPFAGGSPKSDWMMIGAAFDSEPLDFFIKLSGPISAVDELTDDFRSLVESARAE